MKNKRKSILVIALFLISMLAIHQLFFLYGDDFFYGTFIKYGFSGFIKRHINHYMTYNGRAIIHIIVSLLLKYDVYLWRILNPVFITATLILMVQSTKKSDTFSYIFVFGLFLMISVKVMSESIYWLDGSINYLYPIFMLLLTNYLLQSERERPIILAITTFLSAASFEQASVMTIGLILLTIITRYLQQKKVPKYYFGLLIIAILGTVTVLLAPGILLRKRVEVDNPPLLEGMLTTIKWYFTTDIMLIFHVVMMVLLILYFISIFKKNRKNIFSIAFAMTSLGSMIVLLLNHFNMVTNQGIVWLAIILYSLLLIFTAFITIKENNQIFIFLILSLGSQIMLSVSPSLRYRTFIPPLLAFFVVLVHVFCLVRETGGFKKTSKGFSLVLLILGILNTIFIANGYNKNKDIHKHNRQIIKEAYEDPDIETVIIERLVDNDFGHEPLEGSDFHLSHLADYYRISDKHVLVRPSEEAAIHKVFLNGEELSIGTPPIVSETQAFIPINELTYFLNYETNWDREEEMVTIIYQGHTYYLPMGESYIKREDGELFELDYYLRQIEYRTVLEAHDFAKFFGFTCEVTENQDGGMSVYLEE